MFLTCLFLGLLASFIVVAPITVLSLIGSKHVERTVFWGIALAVVYGITTWLVFWWGTPVVGFTQEAIYSHFWSLWWLLVLTAIIVGAGAANWGITRSHRGERTLSSDSGWPSAGSWVVAVLLIILCIYGFVVQMPWTDDGAKALAHKANVEKQEPNTYPDTDPNHILLVSRETADFKANQVLASSTQRNIGTIYRVGDGVLQSVDDHLYWVYGLEPTGYRNSNRFAGGMSPGFVVVDAENPSPPATLRLEDEKGAAYRLNYYLGGYLGHKLERYVWSNGYRDKPLSDLTLEIDDDWRPFYTAAVEKISHGFYPKVPASMALIDPQTGEIKRYDLDKVPEWVDRVYSQETVEEMLNWWGRWNGANRNVINEAKANRYKVAPDEDPVLVYTKGGHPVWQAIMTSYNRDTAAAYLALFDARANRVRLYEIQGLTMASAAAETIRGSGNNLKKLEPVHMTLHRIYGQLTWVAPLVKPHDDESAGTGSSASQGLALIQANNLDGGSVVVEGNKADALARYREKLAAGTNNSGPEENSNIESAEGTVGRVNQVVEGGQSVFYFTLADDPDHVYRASAGRTGQSEANLELPLIKIGSKVRVSYLDVGSPRRDVSAYDDLSLTIGSQ